MFDCRACAAKDAEIAWLRKQLTEAMDRFSALTGTLAQLQDARLVDEPEEPEPPSPEEPEMTEQEWSEAELARQALEIGRKGGQVKPDFPA